MSSLAILAGEFVRVWWFSMTLTVVSFIMVTLLNLRFMLLTLDTPMARFKRVYVGVVTIVQVGVVFTMAGIIHLTSNL